MTTIAERMTPAPFTVRPDDSIGDTRDTMLQNGVHCLPVTDRIGHPIGILTSWDLIEEYAPEDSVRNAMTPEVKVIGAHQYVSEAAITMRTNFIRHLVVVDEDHEVIGVVRSLDLLADLV